MTDELQILDVGCGGFAPSHKPLKIENVVHIDINKKSYHLEIVCDIYNLPFPAKTFRVAYASHVLEHIEIPMKAVYELERIAHVVIIKVPNASYYRHRPSSSTGGHYYSWNEWTLKCLLEKFFAHVRIHKTPPLSFSKKRFSLVAKLILTKLFIGHHELTATCRS